MPFEDIVKLSRQMSYPSPKEITIALGIYQIAGGIIGLFLILKFISTFVRVMDSVILILFITICLYCFSILCGIFLLTKKDINFKYSFINQYLQLIGFSVLGYSFSYASGIYLSIGIYQENAIDFKFLLGISTSYISFNINSNVISVYLNLVAAVPFY